MPSRRRFLATGGTAVVGSLAGCLDSLSLGDPAGTEWAADVADTYDAQPLVGDETVVTVGVRGDGIDRTRVNAVERSTGDERWSVDLGRLTGSAIDDEHAYVGLHGGNGATVVAFDLASGDRAWERRVDSLASATALDDGTLYVANGGLTALDTGDGTIRWHRDRLAGTDFSITVAPEDQLTANDGTVYYGDTDGVFAVDGTDGRLAWTWTDDDWRTTTAGPTHGGGSVYAGGEDAVCLARLDTDGTERWTRGFGRARVAGIHAADVLQVATGTPGGFDASGQFGTVYEVDPDDGRERGEFRLDAPIHRTASSDRSFVVTTGANEVLRFESDGTGPDLRHEFDRPVRVGTSDEYVYVHTDGRLLAMDAGGR